MTPRCPWLVGLVACASGCATATPSTDRVPTMAGVSEETQRSSFVRRPNKPGAIQACLVLEELWTGRTTDGGLNGPEDETYVLIAGKFFGGGNDGATFSTKVPSEYWNMDEGEPTQWVRDVTLWQGTLEAGQRVEGSVVVTEEDSRSLAGQILAKLAEAATSIDTTDATLGLVSTILGLGGNLFGENADDLIGGFSFGVLNRAGSLEASFAAKDRATGSNIAGPRATFAMDGDGSDYRSSVDMRAVATGGPGDTFLHAPGGDFCRGHGSEVIAYRTWDNTNWTARIEGERIVHAPGGDFSRSHSDSVLAYKTWDGSNWTLKLEPRIGFRHAPGGDFSRSHVDSVVAYLTWDGSPWTAKSIRKSQ